MRLASRAKRLPWSAVWIREMTAPLAASMRAFPLQLCGRLPPPYPACEMLCVRGSGARGAPVGQQELRLQCVVIHVAVLCRI